MPPPVVGLVSPAASPTTNTRGPKVRGSGASGMGRRRKRIGGSPCRRETTGALRRKRSNPPSASDSPSGQCALSVDRYVVLAKSRRRTRARPRNRNRVLLRLWAQSQLRLARFARTAEESEVQAHDGNDTRLRLPTPVTSRRLSSGRCARQWPRARVAHAVLAPRGIHSPRCHSLFG
jgi:hypothetical protein